MFIFKKLFSQFLFPLPIISYIFIAGLLFLWFSKKQKPGKILVSIGVLLLLLTSYIGVSDRLINCLESQYHTLSIEDILSNGAIENQNNINFIVVLGGGHASDPNLPIISKLNYHSLVRLVEGIRIFREIPGSKLILSGGGVFGSTTAADAMTDVAKAIGVDDNDIIVERDSKDTKDQAKIIMSFVKEDPFVLVTSASHMPRSVAMFKKLGMNPVPMPVGHRVKDYNRIAIGSFFPKGNAIVKTEESFYEFLGICWAKLRGQI